MMGNCGIISGELGMVRVGTGTGRYKPAGGVELSGGCCVIGDSEGMGGGG
jgi:hypothetical protein